MELLIVLFLVALKVIINGCAVYALWNWVIIGIIGLALPTLGFTACCFIGFLIAMLFG